LFKSSIGALHVAWGYPSAAAALAWVGHATRHGAAVGELGDADAAVHQPLADVRLKRNELVIETTAVLVECGEEGFLKHREILFGRIGPPVTTNDLRERHGKLAVRTIAVLILFAGIVTYLAGAEDEISAAGAAAAQVAGRGAWRLAEAYMTQFNLFRA